MPSKLRHVRLAGHAGGQHQLPGAQGDLLAVPLDEDGPFAGCLVVAGALAFGAAPVIELHHLGVHLQPVADLVLRRENRPVLGEVDVGEVVVPDRIVQAEGLVAVPPGVTGTGVSVDDDGRNAELAQPRSEGDPALSAANDHRVGLGGAAELLRFFRAPLQPGLPVRIGAVLGALRSPALRRLLMPLELEHAGQQGPGLAVLHSELTDASSDGRLEFDPALGDALPFGGLAKCHRRRRTHWAVTVPGWPTADRGHRRDLQR